jgi:hypothetical protein
MMNQSIEQLQMLLSDLDSIVERVKQALISTKSTPIKKKETPFFLAKVDDRDLELLVDRINKYKKLRAEPHQAHNSELEVSILSDIFSRTESLIKKISEGNKVSEYVDKGFFQQFTDISERIKTIVH